MRLGGCLEIGLDDNHHMQWEVELLVDELALINLCAQVVFRSGFFQVHIRQGTHIDFVTLLRLGTKFFMFIIAGKTQGCIRTHLRNQVQTGFPNHVGARIIVKVPSHHYILER